MRSFAVNFLAKCLVWTAAVNKSYSLTETLAQKILVFFGAFVCVNPDPSFLLCSCFPLESHSQGEHSSFLKH